MTVTLEVVKDFRRLFEVSNCSLPFIMILNHSYIIKRCKSDIACPSSFSNTDDNGIFIEEPDFSIGGTNVVNGSSRTRDRSLSQGIIGKQATLTFLLKLNNNR